eukprot:TRINITY_DN2827_c0_g1_i4.p1 TRINITY_DN2827_c0_g1~~TRINITY_DN2827_c0_g1_i4.p1  ORF type:complete len:544 (-),score=43.77 TRINITY_DN2827_c0_g1_i4:44-1537(-)
MDLALSFGVNQAQLLAGINSYFGLDDSMSEVTGYYSASGPMIVVMCMFYYSMFVLTDLQHAVRTVFALIALPRAERTKIESNVLVSISYTRLTLSICVVIVRIAVAFTLLITGLVWLSVTSEITEAILNAAALSFVLELDDLLFHATLPSTVQNFVNEMKPIRYKRPRWILEASLPILVSVLAIVTVCRTVMSENMVDMVRIRKELCGGFVDFVSAKNSVGIMSSRRTAQSGSSASYELASVQEMTQAGNPAVNALFFQTQWTDWNVADFERFVKSTAISLPQAYPCADYDHFPWAPMYNASLRSVINNLIANVAQGTERTRVEEFSCGDYRAVCDDSRYPLMRMKCAETCGCGNWTSGLLLSEESLHGGCPPACKPRIQEQIITSACFDLPVTSTAPQDAAFRLAWKRYWDAVQMFAQVYAPDAVDDFKVVAGAKLANGCDDTAGNPLSGASFCSSDTDFLKYHGLRSIVAFCPDTCCRKSAPETRSSDCPRACST